MGNKFVIALGIFFIWILITLLGPKVQLGNRNIDLSDLVSHALALWLVAAVLFLLIAVILLGWRREVGLRGAEPAKSWTLVWFPFLFIFGFLAVAALVGLPSGNVIFFVLINTLFVAISEELMTRGVLFYGALSHFGVWATIIIVSALFGGMHAMNGFLTGDFQSSALQAVSAAIGGVFYVALRLRTNSLLPGIVVHWFWDCAIFVMGAAASGSALANSASDPVKMSGLQQTIMPLLMEIPMFLYAMWLLRGIGKRDKEDFISA